MGALHLAGFEVVSSSSFLSFAEGLPDVVREGLGYSCPGDALSDPRGTVVRDVPHRGTRRTEVAGAVIFRKVRSTRPADALAEWENLAQLSAIGFAVPRPAFVARVGSTTALGVFAVPGRSLCNELLAVGPLDDAARDYLVRRAAEVVRRLHAHGVVHRDMYWHHLFAVRLHPDEPEPSLIDVERAFRPRLRWRRWVVKDLAGLVSSWPRAGGERVLALRFLRAYTGGDLPRGWKSLARSVLRKAARIARHAPRYGGPGALPSLSALDGDDDRPGGRVGNGVRSP